MSGSTALVLSNRSYPTPTVSLNFAKNLFDWETLSTTTSMPTGGSVSRAGQAMYYDSTGKLTYAPNNLVLQSQALATSWSKTVGGVATTPTTTNNYAVAPDGTTTATRVQCALNGGTSSADRSWVEQTLSIQNGVNYVFSFYAKLNTGTSAVMMGFFGAGATVVTLPTVTNIWQRFSFAVTSTNTATSVRLGLMGAQSPATADSIDLLLWGVQVEAVTYQTTPSTYVATTSAAYYGPRFDYDPSTLAAKGLLIEGTRTNWFPNSSGTSTYSYGASPIAITVPGTQAAPDGTNNAVKIAMTSAGAVSITASLSGANTGGNTFSIYLKKGSGATVLNRVGLRNATTATNLVFADINLDTGAITYTVGTTGASVQNVGGGWWRVSLSSPLFTTGDTATAYVASSGLSWAATDYVWVWGAQFEAGLFASSLIQTGASSVTRAAETFAITGYSSNLINATYIDEGTGVTSVQPYNAGVAPSPSDAWLTGLRVYQNAYAGSISSPSWLSFSRTGNAMMTDSTGKLTYAPANMLTYSQDVSNAVWTKYYISGTAAAGIAPDGTLTANLIAEGGATNSHFLMTGSFAQSAGIKYIGSVYLKKGSGATAPDIVQIGMSASVSATNYANFNLSTGVVTASLDITGSIVSVGNGWYRCSVYATAATTSTTYGIIVTFVNNNSTATRNPSYAGSPTSDLYVWGAQFEAVTYETSPGAYIPTTTAAVYGPRYDYDASTVPATPRGLLIEESRANLLTYSEQFDSVTWTKTSASVTANAILSPDGTLSADKLVENSGASQTPRVEKSVTVTASTVNVFSVYLKAGERTSVRLLCSSTVSALAWFNLSNGTIGTTSGTTATITNVGNGWYRCSITITPSTTTQLTQIIIGNPAETPTYTGDGVSGIYLWGAQLEAGAFATSYIPTTSASVTRAADSPTLSGAALTAAGAATGSAIVQTSLSLYGAKNIGLLGDYSNRRLMYNGGTNTALSAYNGSVVASVAHSGWSIGPVRAAVAWDSIGFSVVANNGGIGTQGSVGSPQPMGTAASVSLGYASGYALNGWIVSAAFYNQRLPDAILKSKSAVNAPY